MEDSELEGASDKNMSREIIKRNFKNRDCYTLVVPTTDDQKIKNLENEDKNSLRPEFLKQVDELIKQESYSSEVKADNVYFKPAVNWRGEKVTQKIENYNTVKYNAKG